MAKPLPERIKSALAPGSRATTIEDLIGVIKAEISVQQKRLEIEEGESVNPLLEDADQDEAADRAKIAKRSLARLEHSVQLLKDTFDKRIKSESSAKSKERYEMAKAERDSIAAELKDWGDNQYPSLIALLKRLMINDVEIEEANKIRPGGSESLESAECIARDIPGNFYKNGVPISRLTKWKIPAWDGGPIAWPDHKFYSSIPQFPVGGGV